MVTLYPAVKWPTLLTGVMLAEQVMLVAPGLIETPIWRKGLEAMHVDRLVVRRARGRRRVQPVNGQARVRLSTPSHC